jgi:hypothetical protein
MVGIFTTSLPNWEAKLGGLSSAIVKGISVSQSSEASRLSGAGSRLMIGADMMG